MLQLHLTAQVDAKGRCTSKTLLQLSWTSDLHRGLLFSISRPLPGEIRLPEHHTPMADRCPSSQDEWALVTYFCDHKPTCTIYLIALLVHTSCLCQVVSARLKISIDQQYCSYTSSGKIVYMIARFSTESDSTSITEL